MCASCHSEPFDFAQGKLREESPDFLGILRLRLSMTAIWTYFIRGTKFNRTLVMSDNS